MGVLLDQDPRSYLEAEVRTRLIHETEESVRTTCSFARAERLLGREYHGRFLIEMLQNAADAWRNRPSPVDGERSQVAILIEDGPALIVANRGEPLDARVVIESLGHVGASTKPEGEAIGHKGIGFKSVLEVCAAPQIFSRLQDPQNRVAVQFDPVRAQQRIVAVNGGRWEKWLAGVHGLDADDPLAAIPVLRYPEWIEDIPAGVQRMADNGFDTVIRLPFDELSANRLDLSIEAWLDTVRAALDQVSDRILLLLGTFDSVLLEDQIEGSRTVIRPDLLEVVDLSEGGTRERVRVLRGDEVSTSWYLYRRGTTGEGDLAGEIAFGVRLDDAETPAVLPAVGPSPTAPFHLFFPTRINSGTPFLLHGYFKVDAARTGFYGGAIESNRRILRELLNLAVDAVTDLAGTRAVDLVSLVDRIAAADESDDDLAKAFRSSLLDALDKVPWIPASPVGGEVPFRCPTAVVVFEGGLTPKFAAAFPAAFVESALGASLPNPRLSTQALELIASRHPGEGPDLWQQSETLLLPGDRDVWEADKIANGFRQLLELLTALRVHDRIRCDRLLSQVRGNPDSRLLPAVRADGALDLLPVPDLSEGRAGNRSQLVMARVRTAGGNLVPPAILDLAFLPDGLLEAEGELDDAKPLGVRPFTADNVLDRLNGIRPTDDGAAALAPFLWRLLHQTSGTFSVRQASQRARAVFQPHDWFWCQPGKGSDQSARPTQQRARYLATVPVPCKDGQWRPAGQVCFGEDWAAWLEARGLGEVPSYQARIDAYRALEELAPGPHAVLAPPERFLELLPALSQAERMRDEVQPETDDSAAAESDEGDVDFERHAFLLQLGVWEVPPIEAFENREKRAVNERLPWDGRNPAEWTFGLDGWAGKRHAPGEVHLGEDYRFLWPLSELAIRAPSALPKSIRAGARLYSERRNALLYCTGCYDSGTQHKTWRNSSASDGYPSTLARELQHQPWLACSRDGQRVPAPVSAATAWWHPKPPEGSGLRQSPYRFLTLCGPGDGVDATLRDLAGICTLDGASPEAVQRLLGTLAQDYAASSLAVEPLSSGNARQAFVGLHRLAYERLSDLVADGLDASEVLPPVGVLCELGEELVYRPALEARHDDGQFSTYARHFADDVPLIALARDRSRVAKHLGVQTFEVELTREGADAGVDVTDEMHAILADRFAELLAIVVHHSLGGQTLEVTSEDFARRANRLLALKVHKVDDLIINATVKGSARGLSIGRGTKQDVFLDTTAPGRPVLYHDFDGNDWVDRLRRKVAPALAALVENPAYGATFGLFLQLQSDAEREEYLLDLGITHEAVSSIASRLGVVDKEERALHVRWYTAVRRTVSGELRGDSLSQLEPDVIEAALRSAGLELSAARALVEAGGGDAVRRDVSADAPLHLLANRGVDLADLDRCLREQSPDEPGLNVDVARRQLRRWLDSFGRQAAAVLHTTGLAPEQAKDALSGISVPASLAFSLAPRPIDLLHPVVSVLMAAGLSLSTEELVADATQTLVRLGGFATPEALDQAVLLLYSQEEQARILRERATAWRDILRRLAVLDRTDARSRRSSIRDEDAAMARLLPATPQRPTDLHAALDQLFAGNIDVADALRAEIRDSLSDLPPDLAAMLVIAERHGMATSHHEHIDKVLKERRRTDTASVRRRANQLAEWGIAPKIPQDITAPEPKRLPPQSEVKRVATVKVTEHQDRRKRELGDEGESWALAAIITQFTSLSPMDRGTAIDDVTDLMNGQSTGVRFESATGRQKNGSVESILAHAEPAKLEDLEDDELVDELSSLLHVSKRVMASGSISSAGSHRSWRGRSSHVP